MKLSRLAMWVAVFALIGGIAISSDMDIQALQAKLAAQEARLNDLQAKMNAKSGAAEATGVVSIRKNAVVKIGGQLNTRYMYQSGKVDMYNAAGVVTSTAKINYGNFRIQDAKINFAVQVNDYFDAFFQLNLLDGPRVQTTNDNNTGFANTGISVAQRAWIRWKNVCNSGFGLLIGRNDLVFGNGNPMGSNISGWVGANDVGLNGWSVGGGTVANGYYAGPTNHPGWDYSRTTQITPYWEGLNGKVKFELSIFEARDTFDGGRYEVAGYTAPNSYRKSTNFGFASTSARLTVKPLEGLTLEGSAMNRNRNKNLVGAGGTLDQQNDTAVNFGFNWKPCFFPRMNIWGQWSHGWNSDFWKGRDSDVANLGIGFMLTEQLRFMLQGEYLRVNQDARPGNGYAGLSSKTKGWAIYPAIRYTLPYGVYFEAGYRYETLKWTQGGFKSQQSKLHFGYGQLGFDF